jgi:hypothetical protein
MSDYQEFAYYRCSQRAHSIALGKPTNEAAQLQVAQQNPFKGFHFSVQTKAELWNGRITNPKLSSGLLPFLFGHHGSIASSVSASIINVKTEGYFSNTVWTFQGAKRTIVARQGMNGGFLFVEDGRSSFVLEKITDDQGEPAIGMCLRNEPSEELLIAILIIQSLVRPLAVFST